MRSAFLVFDLVGRTLVLSSRATPEVASIQNLMTVKKRSGLSYEKRVSRVPEDKASPKATGPRPKIPSSNPHACTVADSNRHRLKQFLEETKKRFLLYASGFCCNKMPSDVLEDRSLGGDRRSSCVPGAI